jgi:2-methylisocitrate lyase-like PEP mutase family enzyme
MTSQAEKAQQFRALHHLNSAFILPNPWDVGSARILAQLGFEALATTSAGYAFFRGTLDGRVGRDAMMAHIAELERGPGEWLWRRTGTRRGNHPHGRRARTRRRIH